VVIQVVCPHERLIHREYCLAEARCKTRKASQLSENLERYNKGPQSYEHVSNRSSGLIWCIELSIWLVLWMMEVRKTIEIVASGRTLTKVEMWRKLIKNRQSLAAGSKENWSMSTTFTMSLSTLWQTRVRPSRLRRLLSTIPPTQPQLRAVERLKESPTATASASDSKTTDSNLVAVVRREIWAGTRGRRYY
jgi:hypothetical protein